MKGFNNASNRSLSSGIMRMSTSLTVVGYPCNASSKEPPNAQVISLLLRMFAKGRNVCSIVLSSIESPYRYYIMKCFEYK